MVATDLIETAKRRSSLDDFGEGDFFEALSRLLESCQDEARLNLIGKIALKTDVLETLSARLQMERDRQLYPNITRQEIREPLFIVGLAPQRHQPVASPALRRPGASISVDVGSEIAVSTYARP